MQPRLLSSPLRRAGASLLRSQTDERLVALARDGHDQAFAVIVGRYRPALERYCAQIVGPTRAEDAVQQAFVNAHAALTRDERDIALQAWLYRIAHNAALNMLRRDRTTDLAADPHAVAGRPTHTHAHALAAADAAADRERLRETFAAIAALPDSQRDALVMREIEGRSHEEIAEVLGVTTGAARQHLLRARRALRSAATAITPYPVASFLAGGAAAGGSIAAGTGGALLAKSGAGLAAAALAVGGVVTTTHRDTHRAAGDVTTHAAATAAPSAPATATPVTLATPARATAPASTTRHSRRRHGRHDERHAAAPHRTVPSASSAHDHGRERGDDRPHRADDAEHAGSGGHEDEQHRSGDSGSGGTSDEHHSSEDRVESPEHSGSGSSGESTESGGGSGSGSDDGNADATSGGATPSSGTLPAPQPLVGEPAESED